MDGLEDENRALSLTVNELEEEILELENSGIPGFSGISILVGLIIVHLFINERVPYLKCI